MARATAYGQRTAIIDDRGRHSYQSLDEASSRAAGWLLAGAADLDEQRVAFLVAPGFDHVAIQWGIWRAGGIAVPLPASHPPAELEYLLQDADASIVVADPASAEQLGPLAMARGARTGVTTEVLDGALTPAPSFGLAGSRRALMVYTSGTTGRPKGVVNTHANVRAQIESLITAWEWTPADRVLLVLPLHHVHGILNVVCSALWIGATCEMQPRFESEAAWDRLASGELTVFSAVPTIYHRLIQSWDQAAPDVQRERSRGCAALRLMMSGSAALPRQVLGRWKEISGHVLLERYGMTEVGMALSNPLHGERRPGFVGRPLPGVSARLVDGELQLNGPGVFGEYWKRPDATREAFRDGWFLTGDAAVLEDGAYRLLGRSSVDILKSGGDKVSALEIEEVLRTHPSISECAVVGVDDPEWGQRVCAAVELRPACALDLGELRDWAKARLAPSKIPKDLICVPQLPRNAMGKVVKPDVTAYFARPAQPGPRET